MLTNISNCGRHYRKSARILLLALLMMIVGEYSPISAQFSSSPARWHYPQGNSEGTRRVDLRSGSQSFDSLRVKWSTPLISGHVQPLIGNIVSNDKIFSNFPFAPNEMAAVVGDRIVVLDGRGKTIINEKMPSTLNGVIGVSALLDTNFVDPNFPFASPTVVLGLETIEAEREDSLAVAFIIGFNHNTKKMDIIRRFSMNLKDQAIQPNVSASLKPVYARKDGDDFMLYAVFNMSQPSIGNEFFVEAPFLRGITQFNTSNEISTFPLPDIGDDITSRVTLGPEVSFAQPSQTSRIDGKNVMMLPSFPTPNLNDIIPNDITSGGTAPNTPYVTSFDLTNPFLLEDFPLLDMSTIAKGSRPRVRPMFVNLHDNATTDSMFVLILEEYNGRDGSNGKAMIHLFDLNGNQITSPENINEPPYLPPSFAGGSNHYWSVGIGEIDGNSSNSWGPHFPNNYGNEIVVTQSSKEFAFAGSRLSILRYYSGPEINKPSPPGEYLFALDTIASQKINGWVAAVNDFDGNLADGKDEIFLVDGSDVIVLRMRNYLSTEFRLGMPFDTVLTLSFPNQTISNLAIADMDGDGLNDMVVTTFDTTFVLGSPLRQTIAVTEPRYYNTPATDYCPLDTVRIKWTNITGTGKAHLIFVETIGGLPNPFSKIDTIAYDIPNMLDEEEYIYIVDDKVLGKSGFFIVASAANPTRNYDTTTIMNFHNPNLIVDNLQGVTYYSGAEFYVSGKASCADSVRFDFSYDGLSWETLSIGEVMPDDSFAVYTKLPCLDMFNCSSADKDSVIYAKVYAIRGNYYDSTLAIKLKVLPSPFPVVWDSCKSNCPTLEFKWQTTDFQFQCDTVVVSVSADFGRTFTEVAVLPAMQSGYTWLIPRNLPDTVMLRFCCQNSCIRTDTLIGGIQPSYIQTVSPNPVRGNEIMEVVYYLPMETNVTIRIYDQSNRIVSELVKSQSRLANTYYCDRWDGRLPDGSPAANGMYYISLELSDGSREVYPVYIRK